MSDILYTTQDLERDTKRYVLTPKQARARLMEIRDLIDVLLLTSTTDAERVSTYKKIKRRIGDWRFSEMKSLAVWSKIAARTKETL